MRLGEFIRTNPDEIEREWEQCARTLTPSAPSPSVSTFRDYLGAILNALADEIASPQSTTQQIEKSQGESPNGDALDRIAAAHASLRLDSGFDLEHAIAEYRALRASILRLWSQTTPSRGPRDIDEVTRFDETIDQAIAGIVRRFADNATRYGDHFVRILAHDLRTPLNLISLAASHLDTCSLEEAEVDSVSQIFRGVRRIDRLVSDLTILARSRSGNPLPLKKANADLGVICERALEEIKASYSGVVFELHRTGDLTGSWDCERLSQAVSNLVANPIVYASAKQVDLVIEGEGSVVVLKVSNQGGPIIAENLDSMVEPFAHKKRNISHELPSRVWLALFILREIVKAHGGTVQVSSSESEGTTFTMRLPRTSPSPVSAKNSFVSHSARSEQEARKSSALLQCFQKFLKRVGLSSI